MHFGENVREIVSISCGKDLRVARSRTVLPGIDSPEVQRRLAANLEQSFDITLSPEDVSHLKTVRAVLQCVRLRRWERELANQEQVGVPAPVAIPEAAAAATAPSLRERFVRYTPPATPMAMPASPSVELRKS
jgi:acyl carrier protein